MKEKTLEQFEKHGMDASFHFADDTGKEWSLGYSKQRKALKLYFSNPDLQREMEEIAKKFLWSLNLEKKYYNKTT